MPSLRSSTIAARRQRIVAPFGIHDADVAR
jgi:hypothetical protein